MPIDEAKLQELLGTMVTELGAATNAVLILIGDKLGLFKALAESGPLNSVQLAERTDTAERYVREWLAAQTASGFVEYDAQSEAFSMTPEQIAVFADEASPVLMTGGFHAVASVFADEPKVLEAFQSGEGISWGDHDQCLFCGTAKFFRPTYSASIVSSWLPALEGVTEKLEQGGKVADVGCGYGLSTIIMAEAYPQSHFTGFDFHESSIHHARQSAEKAGLKNISFEVAEAKEYPGQDYDLVTFFDCLHDMGDPVGAASHVQQSLKSDGSWMIVEPFANDTLEENTNIVGRVYYAFSSTVCVPSSLSQEVGLALGAQAGERRLREVVETGGFTHFRRATETPFNLILEARP